MKSPPAQPASNVVVETTTSGMLAPTSPFVGTVKFTDISSVAAESAGKIKTVKFEEGDIISRGSILAVIDSEILQKSIAEAVAALGQIEANLQLAKKMTLKEQRSYTKVMLHLNSHMIIRNIPL